MSREWYFVRRVRPHERQASPDRFEIQVLDDEGRAMSVGYLGSGTSQLTVDGHEVPTVVIEAAKKCEQGVGRYMGSDGQSLPSF